MPPGISKLVLWNFLIFKTGTLGCFCFSKGTISQTWDFWGTKAAKSTSFEGKKVPKYQFLKYQVAYQAVFKIMSKKKKKKKAGKKWKKNELLKWKKILKKKLILLFLRTRPTGELAMLKLVIFHGYVKEPNGKNYWPSGFVGLPLLSTSIAGRDVVAAEMPRFFLASWHTMGSWEKQSIQDWGYVLEMPL